MKLFEALKFYREPLKRLILAGFKLDDCRFIDLYDDYLALACDGSKKEWIVNVLAQRHHISIRKVYYIIKHMETDCTPCAV